jgi:hypothetical protein
MAPAQAEADARRSPRTKYDQMVQITPWSERDEKAGAPRQKAKMVDASARGLGMLMQSPLEPGSHFILHVVQGKMVTDFLCKVVHCRPAQQNLYDVGAEFIRAQGKPRMLTAA